MAQEITLATVLANKDKAYIIKASSPTIEEVSPKNGTYFTLDELKSFIGGGYIELTYTADSDGRFIVCDEEGKLKNMPLNFLASHIYKYCGSDIICGDVVVCPQSMIK